MRQFTQAVLERRARHGNHLATVLYETAWASEAIFFITVEELTAQSLLARVQISPDGILWVDEGSVCEPITAPGLHFLRVRHFGGWLRLACELSGGGETRVLVHLVLKE